MYLEELKIEFLRTFEVEKRWVTMDFHDGSNLGIPNTKSLYRPIQLSEPKTSINVPLSFVRRLHGIIVDIHVLYLKH